MGKRMTISFLLPGELLGDILCLIAAMLYADAWFKTTLQWRWLRDRLNERDDIQVRQDKIVQVYIQYIYMGYIDY